jgi:hypothetical protein
MIRRVLTGKSRQVRGSVKKKCSDASADALHRRRSWATSIGAVTRGTASPLPPVDIAKARAVPEVRSSQGQCIGRGDLMFWELIIAAGAVGVSIGLWFRVPALIAASVLVAAAGIAAGFMRGRPAFAVLDIALALTTLQVGYLLGLLLTSRCRR